MSVSDLIGGAIGVLLSGLGIACLVASSLRGRRSDRILLFFGIWCALYGLRLLADTPFVVTTLGVPKRNAEYFRAFVTYTINVPIVMSVEAVIGPGWKQWIRRLWQSGGRALYVPDLVAYTSVPSTRLTRRYHRRWHSGHGRFYALLRAAEFERSSKGAILGVPAHVYRATIASAGAWIASLLTGRTDDAFTHEVRLRFLRGFFSQRVREHFAHGT